LVVLLLALLEIDLDAKTDFVQRANVQYVVDVTIRESFEHVLAAATVIVRRDDLL